MPLYSFARTSVDIDFEPSMRKHLELSLFNFL